MDAARKPGVGVGVMIIREGSILLGKRHPDPEKADSELHGEGTWTMPGGKLHFGERLEEAACREVLEETGVRISEGSLRLVSISNDMANDAHFITIGFLCKDYGDEPEVMEPDEITEWKWFSLDELPEPLFAPSRMILENYRSNAFYRREK